MSVVIKTDWQPIPLESLAVVQQLFGPHPEHSPKDYFMYEGELYNLLTFDSAEDMLGTYWELKFSQGNIALHPIGNPATHVIVAKLEFNEVTQ